MSVGESTTMSGSSSVLSPSGAMSPVVVVIVVGE